MSNQILNLIVEELDQYIKSVRSDDNGGNLLKSTDKIVVLGNIATSKLAGGDNSALEEKVVVSLVNVAEEGSLKNKLPKPPPGKEFIKEPPPVHVNLYLMFTANFSDYKKAISYLFRVLEFFQGRKIFDLKSALRSSESTAYPGMDTLEARIEMDLHTLSFEQLNDLWGSLGGKEMPFVLYRGRLITIRMQRTTGRAAYITEVELATGKTQD